MDLQLSHNKLYPLCLCLCLFIVLNRDIFEPRREKTGFLHMRKTKTQISFAVTAKLIRAFVFATRIVQSLYFLNPKFQASSYLLLLYSLVCVGPGRKPRRPVFSERGSFVYLDDSLSRQVKELSCKLSNQLNVLYHFRN